VLQQRKRGVSVARRQAQHDPLRFADLQPQRTRPACVQVRIRSPSPIRARPLIWSALPYTGCAPVVTRHSAPVLRRAQQGDIWALMHTHSAPCTSREWSAPGAGPTSPCGAELPSAPAKHAGRGAAGGGRAPALAPGAAGSLATARRSSCASANVTRSAGAWKQARRPVTYSFPANTTCAAGAAPHRHLAVRTPACRSRPPGRTRENTQTAWWPCSSDIAANLVDYKAGSRVPASLSMPALASPSRACRRSWCRRFGRAFW